MGPYLDMDHYTIDQHNLVDLYLMGKLSSEEAARFEIHFLSCAECVTQLEETEALRTALKASATATPTKAGARSRISTLRAWQKAALVAAALLLVAALPAAWFSSEIRALRREMNEAKATALARTLPPQNPPVVERTPASASQDQSPRAESKPIEARPAAQARVARVTATRSGSVPAQPPQVNTPIFSLNAVRGGPLEVTKELLVSRRPQLFLLSLDLAGEPPYSTYRATIFAGGRQVWRNRTLRPNQFNALVMAFDSRLFHAGEYLLTLEGLRPKDKAAKDAAAKDAAAKDTPVLVGNYPLRVIKQP